jgi:uncharacterized protein YkwD
MVRFFYLCLAALALPVMAQACDMRAESRADTVADYVENGRSCLAAAPNGFRFSAEMEQAFVDKINDERAERGLSTLSVRLDMQPAARFHSLDMGINGFFGHETPKGRTSAFRLSAFDRTMLSRASAENVAQLVMTCADQHGNTVSCDLMPASSTDVMGGAVDKLHADLMASPGHRENILNPETTHLALGVARTDMAVYVTQVFARPVGELSEPFPLRLTSGSELTASAELNGWRFKRFAFLRGSVIDDVFDGVIPDTLEGDLELAARGESFQKVKHKGRTVDSMSFIYLPGPAVTIEPSQPATGS